MKKKNKQKQFSNVRKNIYPQIFIQKYLCLDFVQIEINERDCYSVEITEYT